jgi:predicted acyltransferase
MSGNYTKIQDNLNKDNNQSIINVNSQNKSLLSMNSRLESLDMLRGFCIFIMILINISCYFPSNYMILIESEWNGLSPADTISPFFLFIMGYASNLSHSKKYSKKKILFKGLIRFILFSLIGASLNFIQNQNLSNLRFPSVMFRLGLCSLITSIFSIMDIYVHLLFILSFMTAYTYLVYLFQVPFCEVGSLSPDCFAGGYIDSLVFTKSHMILPLDPEGLLSTLTAQYTVFSGYLLAYNYNSIMINCKHAALADILKFKIFYKWSLILIANIILCSISIFLVNIPLNKKMYSISFTFSVTTICIQIFTILFSMIDLEKNQFSKFIKNYILSAFTILGKNSLIIYIGHNSLLLGIEKIKFDVNSNLWTWAFNILNKIIPEGKLVSLIISIIYSLVWFILAFILYKFKFILKI